MVWEHACTLEVLEVPSHAEMVRDLFIALRAVKDRENHVVRGEIWGSNGISIIGPCFFVCLFVFFFDIGTFSCSVAKTDANG